MKISEVISLLRAGYSKKEIDELRASENVSTPAIEDVSKPEEAAQPAPEKDDAARAPAGQDDSEVLDAIKDLTRTIQAMNIRKDPLKVPEQESAVDILGSIINPKK